MLWYSTTEKGPVDKKKKETVPISFRRFWIDWDVLLVFVALVWCKDISFSFHGYRGRDNL